MRRDRSGDGFLARGLIALFALAHAAPAPSALAQVGLGAERYEVTITPPKRPGTGTAAAAPEAAGASAPAAEAARSGESAPSAAAASDTASPADTASSAETASPADAPVAAAPPPSRPPQNLPLRTLQVGAFRQNASAESLKDRLSASFADVAIVEVQSGGEPLYRVNVGRLPHGPELDDLRRRLVAAGHPAFEVPAPTMPAAN